VDERFGGSAEDLQLLAISLKENKQLAAKCSTSYDDVFLFVAVE